MIEDEVGRAPVMPLPTATDGLVPPVVSAATGGLLPAGTVLGEYRLVSLLGEGGMSFVYEAVDTRSELPVALKVLRPEMARDRDTVARFLREAQAASRIAHAGIARILGTGVDDATGSTFIAMERVPGPSLRRLLEESGGQLDVVEVADLGVQLAETLAAAHALGIVHRDIKPDNILVVRDGGAIRTKLVDFGIAKLRADAWGGNHTRSGMLLGTPAYMAPEQASAQGEVDARADIYALGCVLYQCLGGAPPFADREGIAVLLAHQNVAPAPLRDRAPWVPAAIDKLVLRMLAKKPSRRPQTMLEVRDALDPLAAQDRRPTRDHLVADLQVRLGAGQKTVMLAPPPGAAGAVGDRWSVLGQVLPPAFASDEPLLRTLLSLLFGSVAGHGARSLALFEPSFAAAADRQFFATFVASRGPADASAPPLGRLETRMFFDAVQPLAEDVARLGVGPGTVVIAIVDGAELGPGVGEVILTCRRRHGIAVVPLYIGELRRVAQSGQLRQLFQARVIDLHGHENPFSMVGPSTDPTRCVGMGAQVGLVVSLINEGGRIISVSGAPRCGKSTLLGLAEYACENELGGRVFVPIRCSELPAGDPLRLVEHIRARLAASDAPPTAGGPASIHQTVATFVRDQRLVLVIEDADWLIRMSAPDYPDRDKRAQAVELWTALADNVRSHRNTVIVTSVRGMDSASLRDTFTAPAAVHNLLVAPLDLAGSRRVITELGRSIGFLAADDAVAHIHRQSGGNVFVLRALCAAIVDRARQQREASPFLPVTASRRDVAAAATELAGYIRTFHRHIMELLDEDERRVLHHVARRQPRTVRAVRRALPDVRVIPALKALEDMGYVRHDDGRHRVAVPLLADWLRRNLDPAPVEGERMRHRRISYLALGASATALLLGIYFTWLASERVLTRAQGPQCQVSVDHPRRAGAGETVRLHVLHTCAPAVQAAPGQPPPANVHLRAVQAAAAFPTSDRFCPVQHSCGFDVTVEDQASPVYQLAVDVDGQRVEVAISRDSLGEARRVLASGVRFASLLPLLIASFLAYQRELRGVLRKLLRLGSDDGPDGGPAPTATAGNGKTS